MPKTVMANSPALGGEGGGGMLEVGAVDDDGEGIVLDCGGLVWEDGDGDMPPAARGRDDGGGSGGRGDFIG